MDTQIIAHALYARENGTTFTQADLNKLLELIGQLTELAAHFAKEGVTK